MKLTQLGNIGKTSCTLIVGLSFLASSTLVFAKGGEDAKYTPHQWGFTSDHLPRGGRVLIGKEQVRIATFNVLNRKFWKWIDKSTQQLEGSTLQQMGLNEETQNRRDLLNANLIINALIANEVGIFCVQESSGRFAALVKERLKETGKTNFVVRSAQNYSKNDDGSRKDDYGLIIFDSNRFEAGPEQEPIPYGTKYGEDKYIQTMVLRHKESGEHFHLVNTHLTYQAGAQLAKYLNGFSDKVIVMGDLNLGYSAFEEGKPKDSELDIHDGLMKRIPDYRLLDEKDIFTHISTFLKLDVFDHIIAKGLEILADPDLNREMQKSFSLMNWEAK